jgi:hypothetical protein
MEFFPMKQVDRVSSPLGTIRKKAVWGCRSLGVALVAVSLFAACEQAPRSIVGPTAITGAAFNSEGSAEERWGSLGQGVMHSAANESGFVCALGPFGRADDSHATISNSGNETVVCSGKTAASPDQAQLIEGFPCSLHFGDGDPTTPDVTTDSRAVVSPSGHVTLVCKS